MIHTTTSRILESQKEKVQCLQETTPKFFFLLYTSAKIWKEIDTNNKRWFCYNV